LFPQEVYNFIYMKATGLGDTIEKITAVTGVKNVVGSIFKSLKKPCGCQKRKEALNKKFPYGV